MIRLNRVDARQRHVRQAGRQLVLVLDRRWERLDDRWRLWLLVLDDLQRFDMI